jgi:hypothetical protein
MKTYLVYGFAMSAVGFLLQLVLFILGYHTDIAKFNQGQWIGSVAGILIGIAAITMGTKAGRAAMPEDADFSYGKAVGAGVKISLFAAILDVVLNYLYVTVINPGFTEFMVQAKLADAQAKGMDPVAIDQMEKGMRMMGNPVFSAVMIVIVVMFFGTLISLVTAAFLKRPAPGQAASAQ